MHTPCIYIDIIDFMCKLFHLTCVELFGSPTIVFVTALLVLIQLDGMVASVTVVLALSGSMRTFSSDLSEFMFIQSAFISVKTAVGCMYMSKWM